MSDIEIKPYPSAASLADLDLLIANAQKDPQAFALLYDQFLSPLYRYIYQRVHNRQDAEEITSQTFLQPMRHFLLTATAAILQPGFLRSHERSWRTITGRPTKTNLWKMRLIWAKTPNIWVKRSVMSGGAGCARSSRAWPKTNRNCCV